MIAPFGTPFRDRAVERLPVDGACTNALTDRSG
jgi:hypothetical protein